MEGAGVGDFAGNDAEGTPLERRTRRSVAEDVAAYTRLTGEGQTHADGILKESRGQITTSGLRLPDGEARMGDRSARRALEQDVNVAMHVAQGLVTKFMEKGAERCQEFDEDYLALGGVRYREAIIGVAQATQSIADHQEQLKADAKEVKDNITAVAMGKWRAWGKGSETGNLVGMKKMLQDARTAKKETVKRLKDAKEALAEAIKRRDGVVGPFSEAWSNTKRELGINSLGYWAQYTGNDLRKVVDNFERFEGVLRSAKWPATGEEGDEEVHNVVLGDDATADEFEAAGDLIRRVYWLITVAR